MVLKAGELYFLGELDHRTQQPTPYVKIGIVRESDVRDTAQRLKEHQTGNPRQIVEVAVLGTPNVERVETTMHGLYAPYGVGGEWFERSGAELAATIRHAEELVATMRTAEVSLHEAERLARVESSGELLDPDSTVVDLHRRLLELRAVDGAISAASDAVRTALWTAHGRGLPVDRWVSVQSKAVADAFDKDAFAHAHPDVHERFLTEKQRMSQRFNPTKDKSLEVSVERLAPNVIGLSQAIAEVATTATEQVDQAAVLHRHYLNLLVEKAAVELEMEMLAAAVKTACGVAPGISGVCTWKRELKTELKLDESALKRELPELYARYLVARPPTTAVVVSRHRGYAW